MAEKVVMDPVGVVVQQPRGVALEPFVTATAEHYVIAHHGIARCSEEGWTLTVDGLVERELRLTLGGSAEPAIPAGHVVSRVRW
jgi:hypothetical protein